MRTTVLAYVAFCTLLAGCVTTPDGGRELTATGKVALQEVTAIAVRRALVDSPRMQEKAQNIREIAAKLQSVTEQTTVSGLREVAEQEISKLGLAPVDHADAISLLNVFAALLIDYIGKDDLEADALVRVNEFVTLVVAALPPVPSA